MNLSPITSKEDKILRVNFISQKEERGSQEGKKKKKGRKKKKKGGRKEGRTDQF